MTAEIDNEFYDGSTLAEIAENFGIEVQTTEPATGDGRIFNQPGQTLPPAIAPVLRTAFTMEEGDPQLAEVVRGQTFIIYDVAEIIEAAPPPLSEIKPAVTAAWKRSEGSAAAKEVADKIMDLIGEGKTMTDALREAGVNLPADRIDMNRNQLQQLGQRVPPVLALLFSMAEGTYKRLEAPNLNGWFIAQLEDIEPGEVPEDSPFLLQISTELDPLASDELAQQLSRAISAGLGVERNDDAIAALRATLTGADQQ
jgi:peptidyl-prolyl cis-trans isomerase D